MRGAALCLPLLVLAACSSDGDRNAVDVNAAASRAEDDIADYHAATALPAVAEAAYRCGDGTALAVRFDNRADVAAVRVGDAAAVTLRGQRPASGIWYAGDGYELRGKGRAATFTRPGGASVECTAG